MRKSLSRAVGTLLVFGGWWLLMNQCSPFKPMEHSERPRWNQTRHVRQTKLRGNHPLRGTGAKDCQPTADKSTTVDFIMPRNQDELNVSGAAGHSAIFVVSLQDVHGASAQNSARLDAFRDAWRADCGTQSTLRLCPGMTDSRPGFGLTLA